MQQCRCEHWQECPVCKPRRFDKDGKRLPPEPTPLQDARSKLEAMESHAKRLALSLEKAAKEMLRCVDRMLRDGEWYAAQEKADALRAALEQAEPVDKALTKTEPQVDKEQAEPLANAVRGECRLWDSQWTNVVNHADCYRDWSKADAINHAVKMTETYMAWNVWRNHFPPVQAKPGKK